MFVRDWRLAVIALVVFPFIGAGGALDRTPPLPHQPARHSGRSPSSTCCCTRRSRARRSSRPSGARRTRSSASTASTAGLLSLALKDHRTDELTEPLMEVLAAFGHHGRPLVRRPPGHRRHDDARRFLLVHGRGRAALRAGPTALADRQHRPAVDRVRRAGLRDPRLCRRPSPTGRTPCVLDGVPRRAIVFEQRELPPRRLRRPHAARRLADDRAAARSSRSSA